MTERDFVHRGFGGVATSGDIASSVVLVTSREEVEAVVGAWTDTRLVADHYAYLVWTGRAGGVRLTACSTGTGSASAAIAIEELAILGARTLLGIGATRRAPEAVDGVIIAEGAFRADAASHGYARIGYPAGPDVEVVMAAVAAGRAAGARLLSEIVADLDAPSGASIGEPARPSSRSRAIEAAIAEARAVTVHASPATLFVQGAIHGLRTGFLAAADTPAAQASLRTLATATLVRLAAWDDGGDGIPVGFAARIAAMPPGLRSGHR